MWNSAQQRGYRNAEFEAAKQHGLMRESGRTAIGRKNASLPTRWLHNQCWIKGQVLDFGCGKGADVRWLTDKGYSAVGYDPNHLPAISTLSYKYDTVICNYVLNVVQPERVQELIDKVQKLLRPDGVGYFTVRRDIKKEGFTSRNTYQHNVLLDLDVHRETATYCIYKIEGIK